MQSNKEQPVKEEEKVTPYAFRVHKDLGFIPSIDEVFFVELEPNSLVRNYIIENREKINSMINKSENEHFQIITKETWREDIIKDRQKYIKYNNPELLNVQNVFIDDTNKSFDPNKIIDHRVSQNQLAVKTGFIWFDYDSYYPEERAIYHIFHYFDLNVSTEKELVELLEYLSTYKHLHRKGYDIVKAFTQDPKYPEKEDKDDYFFELSYEQKAAIENIKKQMQYLSLTGIRGRFLLETLIKEETFVSKLVVTKDSRIILSDYEEQEIVMTPLPKAIYLLFLKHPEGILFKHLSDHKKELVSFYEKVTNRKCDKTIKNSINAVLDSTSNSINENCSRIRKAFMEQFCEEISQNYIITGQAATPKKITLDRSLVIWECDE